MPNVYWSAEAEATFKDLPPRARRSIEEKLELARQFPELYAQIETGRYRGYRRIPVLRRYSVVYRPFGEAQNCFVRAILFARAAPQ